MLCSAIAIGLKPRSVARELNVCFLVPLSAFPDSVPSPLRDQCSWRFERDGHDPYLWYSTDRGERPSIAQESPGWGIEMLSSYLGRSVCAVVLAKTRARRREWEDIDHPLKSEKTKEVRRSGGKMVPDGRSTCRFEYRPEGRGEATYLSKILGSFGRPKQE